MTKEELNLLLGILSPLTTHFKRNPDSLLAKIFGVFTVKSKKTGDIYLMLMENTLQLKKPERLNYIFDLKGSLVDRKVHGQTSSSTTLKDVNFLMAAQANENFIELRKSQNKRLLRLIKNDV